GLQDQARTQYAEAAQAYETAAGQAPPGVLQTNWLIHSADRYARAGQADRGMAALARLAQAGGSADEHVAAAWYVLGEALHQRRDVTQARDAYRRSLAAPGPYQTKARLQIALLDLAESKLDDAEKALLENQ